MMLVGQTDTPHLYRDHSFEGGYSCFGKYLAYYDVTILLLAAKIYYSSIADFVTSEVSENPYNCILVEDES